MSSSLGPHLFNLNLVSNVLLLCALIALTKSWQPEEEGQEAGRESLMIDDEVLGRPSAKSSSRGQLLLLRRRRPHRVPRSANFRLKEKQILDSILGPSVYDSRIRPIGIHDPAVANVTGSHLDGKLCTIVNVNVYLRSINAIDDYKMEFSVQLTFREQWNDQRLKFDDYQGKVKYLTLTDPRKVWMPDTFFRNEKVGHFHSILVNNVYVRIFPNGDVLFSIRISLTLSCPMNLKLYPMDRQTCSMKMASYGYTTDDIYYLWKNQDPVQIAPGLNLPRFSIEKYSSSYCNVKTNTGEYSCLSVDLVFKRQFSYYMITIYVPGCMLVVVSWVSFWLDPHAVPARVSLGVTTLLTMSTQTASINNSLPPVAYTKAIDVWQGVCVTFVFSALLEYALVNYALRGDRSYRRGQLFRRDQNEEGFMFEDTEAKTLSGNSNSEPMVVKRRSGDSQESLKTDWLDPEKAEEPQTRSRSRNLTLSQSKLMEEDERGEKRLVAVKPSLSILSSFMSESSSSPSEKQSTKMYSLLFPSLSCLRGGSTAAGGDGDDNDDDDDGESHHPRNNILFFSGSSSAKNRSRSRERHYMDKAKRIDVTSRILFPLIFAIFNTAYWSTYLLQAQAELTAQEV